MCKNIFKKIVLMLLIFTCSLFGFACKSKYSVKFRQENVSIYVGESVTLEVETLADMVNAKWSSNNEKVAKVEYGIVTGIGVGEAKIKLSVAGKTVYAKVTVIEKEIPLPPEVINTIRVTLNKLQLKLYVGSETQLKATTYLNNTITDSAVVWSSSNRDVCVVDGGNVQAVGEGTATVYATYKYDGIEAIAQCTVNVVSVTEIIVPTKVVIGQGETFQLFPQCSGKNVFSYKSSDTDVVRVSENGLIEHISNGEATITVQNQASIRALVNVYAVEKVVKISDAEGFMGINNSANGTYYLLTANVDLTGVPMKMYADKSVNGTAEQTRKVHAYDSVTAGVHSYIDEFGDVLDGNGYKVTISNASTKDTKFNVMGLFNCITQSGVIKNLQVDTTVITYAKLGGVGNKPCTATFAYVNRGKVVDCFIDSKLYLANVQTEPVKNHWSALILEQTGTIKDCIICYDVYNTADLSVVTQSRAVFIGGGESAVYENVLCVAPTQEMFAVNYLGGATTTSGACSGYIYPTFNSLLTGENGVYYAPNISGVESTQKGYLNFNDQVWTFNQFDKEIYFINYGIYSENDPTLKDDVLAEDIF